MTEAKLAHFDNVTKTLISMIRKNTGPDEHNGGTSSEDVIILNYFNLYITNWGITVASVQLISLILCF